MSLIKIKPSNIETTGVTAGSYTAADITVNSSGQITSASNSTGGSGSGLQHTTYTYTADGNTTTFAATSGITANTVLVLVDGITQVPTTDYTVSSSNVVFTSAPPNNAVIQIRVLGDVVASGVTGPKIASIQVTDSGYTTLDDTAVNISGGYIKIVGTGFVTGCTVIIGSVVATSVSFISSTEVRAQVPAQAAGTYTVYLVNPDGGVGIRVNGVNYSSTPTWTTTSPLPGSVKDSAISIQLVATSNSAVTYALQAGSTLPTGLTLSSSGLLAGAVTGISVETTFNFTIVATDAENQDTPQAFQITINVGDPYYPLVSLHLPGNGTNLANNNTFVDSSGNNFSITRNGNTTQGTFSPFSQTGWSGYFDGTTDFVSTPTGQTNLTLGTSDFTIEGWFYIGPQVQTDPALFTSDPGVGLANTIMVQFGSATLRTPLFVNNVHLTASSTNNYVVPNQWNHIAVCRTGGSTYSYYINGVAVNNVASNSTSLTTNSWRVGYWTVGGNAFAGNISNFRIIKGTALYSGATITVPTAPLTAVANTQLLILQSNRFIDNSTNNFTITRNGDTRVVAFSPFNPTASWSAATNGGSGYFDGSGDYLQLPAGTAFAPGTGDFTVDGWFYTTVTTANQIIWSQAVSGTNYFVVWADPSTSTVYFNGTLSGGGVNISSTANLQVNAWNYFSVRRASGTVTVYLNGVAGTGTSNTVDFANTSYVPTIGRYTHAATNHFTGYIANLRYVKGTAITPSGVPTSPNTAVSGTSALLNFTNAGIYDATSKNDLETVGNAQISTTQSKWGGSSMYFDGTGDYVTSYNANALFRIGNIYTIELWFYTTTIAAGAAGLICLAIGASTNSGINIYRSGSEIICNDGATGGTGPSSGSSAITTNTWTHLAVVSDGTTTKMYIDGVLKGTYSGTTASSAALTYVTVGANGDKSAVLNGYIQDVRITKGIARYTANFTPPTQAFQTL